jgi:mannose-6-phosphate isomerase-like protein (cupin superfamily)
MSYHTNIIRETKDNDNFRKVLFTGKKSQLVVMDIPPGGEIGEEVHENVEQILFFHSGNATAILEDKEYSVKSGDVVVVTPGTRHNFKNSGEDHLKVFTVYSPANHIDGTIHKTKEDADKDLADEEFGHSQV